MTEIKTEIQFAIKDNCCYLKLKGDIRYSYSGKNFADFSKEIFSNHTISDFVIDMTETEFIDSTNLGIIAGIANRLAKVTANRPVIISDNEDIIIILSTMGFEQFFEIINTSSTVDDLKLLGLDLEKYSSKDLNKAALKAHENLASMNSKNSEMFKDVIELLRKEQDD